MSRKTNTILIVISGDYKESFIDNIIKDLNMVLSIREKEGVDIVMEKLLDKYL
jgi:hypothetical protein